MNAADILLERETANDESAQVVAIYVQSGSPVERDDVLFDIENSKATQEVVATSAGILVHDLQLGSTVAFGVPIARILPAEEWAKTAIKPGPSGGNALDRPATDLAAPAAGTTPSGVVANAAPHPVPIAVEPPDNVKKLDPAAGLPAARPRFSHAAAALLVEYDLSSTQFGTDFVTAHDVRAYLQAGPASGASSAIQPEVKRSSPSEQAATKAGRAVAGHKRAEIDVLRTGAGGTMLSVLGITIGPLDVTRAPGDVLTGRITDLVIYEAARLLRKYPLLNACYEDGRIIQHDAVHAGVAIDGGGRLMVYGIENADRVNLSDLPDLITDAVARYMDHALTAAELSRATFTVTDLSADELDFVLPLLPRGQSCIIGVTHTAATGFRLFCGFDHRVTEGREVAAFLGELRGRLISFAAAGRLASTMSCCGYCGRSLADATGKGKDKGLLKIIDREGRDALCCASCWNGW